MANGTLAVSQLEILTQSGTGIITVVPPATNTNRTITLPDSTGTMATAESTLAQFNASGSAPVYAVRAWVNFNGSGTPAIRASGNVSSITDNGTGNYTVNLTTAMPDTNYSFVGFVRKDNDADDGVTVLNALSGSTKTASALQVFAKYRTNTSTGYGSFDAPEVNVSIFR